MTPRLVEPRTAFVLAGGGGARAQVGMLRALYQRRSLPTFSSGRLPERSMPLSSPLRPQTVTTANQLARAGARSRARRSFRWPSAPSSGGVEPHDHLVPDHGLRRVVRRHLQLEALEQAAIPLHLLTFDVLGGREVLLSRGPALDAVVAAASIPACCPCAWATGTWSTAAS